ncbi:hypothetical protein LCGC14_2734610, partial [marine sediment metagenome]
RGPNKLRKEIISPRPSATILVDILKTTCIVNGVTVTDAKGKNRKREMVMARQMTCYVAVECGFEPADISSIIEFERSGVYHKVYKAGELAEGNKYYRGMLNGILKRFGQAEFEVNGSGTKLK